jgi:hypothetical protein
MDPELLGRAASQGFARVAAGSAESPHVGEEKSCTHPVELVAEVLFRADRTCCVCRIRNKPVQTHHSDDDPSNNSPGNLAVLINPKRYGWADDFASRLQS